MKQVISITVKGKFHQYLMLSEVRLLTQMSKDLGKIEIEVIEISKAAFKQAFGI